MGGFPKNVVASFTTDVICNRILEYAELEDVDLLESSLTYLSATTPSACEFSYSDVNSSTLVKLKDLADEYIQDEDFELIGRLADKVRTEIQASVRGGGSS